MNCSWGGGRLTRPPEDSIWFPVLSGSKLSRRVGRPRRAIEHHQVADCGRLRGASIHPCKMNCQSRLRLVSARQTRAPASVNPPSKTRPSAPTSSAARAAMTSRPAVSVSRRGRRPPVPRSSVPRLLPPTPPSVRPAIVADGPGSEDAALLGREPGPGDPLHFDVSAAPKPGRSRFHQRGEQLHQDEMGDPLHVSAPAGGGSRSNAAASASPLSPGAPVRHRHARSATLAGIGSRASSGAISSAPARRPPSTMKPPRANVQVPMAERCPRPTARASSAGSGRAARASSASARATASPSWVPEPESAVGGDGAVDGEARARSASP